MQVLVGNSHALEGYQDPHSEDPEKLRFRPAEYMERITTITIPDDDEWTLDDCVTNVVAILEQAIEVGHKPDWFETPSDVLTTTLLQHYELPPAAGHQPRSWGRVSPGLPTPASRQATTSSTEE